MVVPFNLEALRQAFNILEHTIHYIPLLDERVVDPEGFAYKVALLRSMFLNGLWLPFYHPVRDVLDMVGVAPT